MRICYILNLNEYTTPNSNLWDGGNSNVFLHHVSDPGETMTAVFGDCWFDDLPMNLNWNNNIKVGGIMTVPAGLTLTISAGSSVNFNQGTRLLINGSLQAIGTSSNKITFTRAGSNGHWDGIYIHDSNMSPDLKHCIIEHADCGVYLRNTTGYVLIENSILQYNTYGLASEYSCPFPATKHSDIRHL